ncbi:MAG: hypothetical protein ABIH63_03050 [archaeon]
MEDHKLEYEVEKGVRYVVGYRTTDGCTFYMINLSISQEETNTKALNMIKEKPALADRLKLLKVKAFGNLDGEEEVMLWTKNPRFFGLEKIYQHAGSARSFIRGSLEEHFLISPFMVEVVKTYKNESRT